MFRSSLSSAKASWDIYSWFNHDPQIANSFKDAEMGHYSCCPSQIAEIIMTVSQLGDASRLNSSIAQDILHSLKIFDPADWASGLQVLRPIHDFTSYYHIGSAYKAAALLFVAQILPDEQYSSHTSIQGQDIPSVVLHHVSQISCRSQLFKFTIWPMYIAGAESTNDSQRSEVLAQFQEISMVIPWQTNNGAASVLGTVWKRTDSSIETARKRRNWLKVFQALDK